MTSPVRQPISSKRILVAEDDLLVAHTIRIALRVEGHTSEIAHDGDEALTLFKAGHYDLVITDFRMPKMDGLELAEAIKKISPGKPVILVTAYAEAIKSEMGKVSNIDVLLGKPFSVKALQDALYEIFRDG